MSKKSIEHIKAVLEKWKFPVLQEDESSVVFRYQMKALKVNQLSDDFNAVSLVMNGIFTCDDDTEKILALKTCNDINCSLFICKTYIDSDDEVIFSVEFLYQNPEDVEHFLEISLQALITSKKRFLDRYKENEAEARLVLELEAACEEECKNE